MKKIVRILFVVFETIRISVTTGVLFFLFRFSVGRSDVLYEKYSCDLFRIITVQSTIAITIIVFSLALSRMSFLLINKYLFSKPFNKSYNNSFKLLLYLEFTVFVLFSASEFLITYYEIMNYTQ